MATYVYNVSDGSLFEWGVSDRIGDIIVRPTPLFNYGLAFKTGLVPLDATHGWNPATLTVIVVAARVYPGGTPVLTDISSRIIANGFTLTAPTDAVTFNLVKWGQPNLLAFHDFSLTHGGWDKLLHSQLWIYLKSKVTSSDLIDQSFAVKAVSS